MTPPAPPRAAAAVPGIDGDAAAASHATDSATHRFRFALAAEPCSAARARRLTRAWLSAWSVCDETCESAALVVSELVTNAIVHTSSRHLECELVDQAGKVRIAVGDEGCTSDAAPAHPIEREEHEQGRGLLLVAAVCSAWGAHERGPGLVVWAELPHAADRRTGNEADTVRGTGAEWVSRHHHR